MADLDVVQPSESSLWAVDPNATPVSPAAATGTVAAPPSAAAPSPAPTVVPERPQIGEGQLWGTQALDTTATPVTSGTPGAATTPAPTGPKPLWDDAEELRLADEERQKALGQKVSHDDTPVSDRIDLKSHPQYGDAVRGRELIAKLPIGKARTAYQTQQNKLEKKIEDDLKAQATEAKKARAEELKLQNEPYTSVEQREKNIGIVGGHVQTLAQTKAEDAKVGTPEEQKQKDYNYRVSPFTTMGTRRKDKDGNEIVDYRPFNLAAGSIASLNKGLPAEVAADVVYIMGSPAGGTNDKGEPVKGANGRTGAGATSYKITGRDESGMVRVKLPDGRSIRIDEYSLNQIEKARLRGWKEAQAWENEQKEKAKPGLGARILKSIIPGKGF